MPDTPSNPDTPGHRFNALNVPVYRASTIVFDDTASFLARKSQLFDGYSYGLYGTPTTRSLESAVAAIEGGTRCLVVPSGLAAVTQPTLALLGPGDHVIVADCVYGPTRAHCATQLRRWGVRVDFMAADCQNIGPLLTERTRLIVLESPGSFSAEIQDIASIADQAHRAGAWVLADNTWGFGSTDLFAHGVDIVSTALSKYASGHSDVCMGSVTVREESLFRKLKSAITGMGLGVSSDDAYLVLRGLSTLDARLDIQAAHAIRMSQWLRGQSGIAAVMNPADPQDAVHARFRRLFRRGNGLVSFIPQCQDIDAIAAMVDGMSRFRIGASWGGTESLVALADLSSLRSAPRGATPNFVVRLHLGLEPYDLLQQDVHAALQRLRSHELPPDPFESQPQPL
jgi:cystathionine beta-lyase